MLRQIGRSVGHAVDQAKDTAVRKKDQATERVGNAARRVVNVARNVGNAGNGVVRQAENRVVDRVVDRGMQIGAQIAVGAVLDHPAAVVNGVIKAVDDRPPRDPVADANQTLDFFEQHPQALQDGVMYGGRYMLQICVGACERKPVIPVTAATGTLAAIGTAALVGGVALPILAGVGGMVAGYYAYNAYTNN